MRTYYLIFVPLFLEGVIVLQATTLRKNEQHIGFVSEKQPIIAEKRSLAGEKRQSVDVASNLLESLVLAIDTGSPKTDANSMVKNADKMVETVVKSLDDVFKNSVKDPVYRSKADEYDIKPELVKIRGNKPTLMVNLKSEFVLKGLQDILRSKLAQRLMKTISEEAGSLFLQVDK